MSMWTQVRLNLLDKDVLKEALDELGYEYDDFGEAKSMGIPGEGKNLKAQIRLKGKGLSDVGFVEEDGQWKIAGQSGAVSRVRGTVMKEINQIYGERKFRKQMQKMSCLVNTRQKMDDGRIRMKVLVP